MFRGYKLKGWEIFVQDNKDELLFQDETYAIRGAIFEVYKEMGCGFLEAVFQECLGKEFRNKGVTLEEQNQLMLCYKGEPLNLKYIPDFICYEKIIVEIKAVTMLVDEHRAQLHNYLKASGLKLGLLVNFGHYPKVEIERIIK